MLEQLAERAYEDVYRGGRFGSSQLTATLVEILEGHATPGAGRLPLAPAAGLARVEEEVERLVVEPLANVVRAGREGNRELLAGLRLAGTDTVTRRLLSDYLRSTETREHVSPRIALSDLFCLSAARRRGHVALEVDMDRLLVVVGAPSGTSPTRTELENRLRAGVWDFVWEHGVGETLSFPVLGRARLRLELGPEARPLPLLSWLARAHPGPWLPR